MAYWRSFKVLEILLLIVLLCKTYDAQSPSTPIPTQSSSSSSITTATTTTTTTLNTIPTKGSENTCKKYQLKYLYTPCDDDGNRWKVQVPKKQNCRPIGVEPPQAGVKCSFSCNAGEYLDIRTQECKRCKPGTYSVGDGKRYATWDKLPDEFSTQGHGSNRHDSNDKCKMAVWKTRGDYLESNGSSCRSVLRYKVELVKPGNISFTVKSGDESSFFHVWVEGSSTCSSSYDATLIDSEKNNEMYYTVTTDWKKHTLDLDKGHNTVYFVAAYFSGSSAGDGDDSDDGNKDKSSGFDSDTGKAVIIKEIIVQGFSYSQQCEKCEAGTFSSGGAASCSPCPMNSYSKGNAGVCTKCDSTEYAPPHSDQCYQRKPCTMKDYHSYYTNCVAGKTTKKYDWFNPRICLKDGTVNLPDTEKDLDCPSCNPGAASNGTLCEFCPKNFKSEGKACVECPPNSRSVSGLFYKIWNEYPRPPMHLYCISRPESGCATKNGWVLKESYISSGIGHADDAELLMYIVVPHFTKRMSVATIDFEILGCVNCRLKIEMIDEGSEFQILEVFEGTTQRKSYSFERHSPRGTRYRLVFEKKYDENVQSYRYSTGRVRIYSVTITNTVIGGAQECENCLTGDCRHCPEGNYIDGNKCTPCPENTYLAESGNPNGIKSCVECPHGTVSLSGSTACHSSCIMEIGDKTYNFTSLSGFHLVSTPEIFTTKGYRYYHNFNISFCGHPYHNAVCKNNATKNNDMIMGAICRSTFIPDGSKILSAQSISIGETLQSVKLKLRKNGNESTDGLIQASETDEVLVTFHSRRQTSVCKNGTSGTITLMCDPRQDGKGEIVLGDDKCNSETCNGCHYLFKWKSKFACRQCTENDVQNITTACSNGKKMKHFLWKEPHVCIGGISKPKDQILKCTIFEKSILDLKVVIMAFLLGAVLLAAIVIWLCYRNRKLSYKYHRLVDASYSKDGELPPAEMCALEDGEEEEENDVILSRGKSGKKILDRIKGLGKRDKNKFTEFETINLDSMKDQSDDDDDEL